MLPPDSNLLLISRHGDVQVIEFVARSVLDPADVEKISRQIEYLVEKAGHPKIVINFSNLRSISSAMLGALLSINKKVQSMKGEMRLAAIPPSIMEVFRLTRLDKVMQIYTNTHAALVKFIAQ